MPHHPCHHLPVQAPALLMGPAQAPLGEVSADFSIGPVSGGRLGTDLRCQGPLTWRLEHMGLEPSHPAPVCPADPSAGLSEQAFMSVRPPQGQPCLLHAHQCRPSLHSSAYGIPWGTMGSCSRRVDQCPPQLHLLRQGRPACPFRSSRGVGRSSREMEGTDAKC